MNYKLGTEMCLWKFLKNFVKTIAKETNVWYSIKGYKIVYNLLKKKRIYDINVIGN